MRNAPNPAHRQTHSQQQSWKNSSLEQMTDGRFRGRGQRRRPMTMRRPEAGRRRNYYHRGRSTNNCKIKSKEQLDDELTKFMRSHQSKASSDVVRSSNLCSKSPCISGVATGPQSHNDFENLFEALDDFQNFDFSALTAAITH